MRHTDQQRRKHQSQQLLLHMMMNATRGNSTKGTKAQNCWETCCTFKLDHAQNFSMLTIACRAVCTTACRSCRLAVDSICMVAQRGKRHSSVNRHRTYMVTQDHKLSRRHNQPNNVRCRHLRHASAIPMSDVLTDTHTHTMSVPRKYR